MATAYKLPSGTWCIKPYSHSEPMYNADGSPVLQKNGKQKMKRIYKTITGATKKEVDFEAAQFMLQKEEELANQPKQKKADYTLLPLTELIDKYIESRLVLNRSLTTIQDYWCIQRNGFQDLMQICVKDMDKELLQESVNMESQRPCKRKKGVTLSPKRLQNEWSLLASVIRKYTSSLDDVLRNIELPEVPERVPDLIPAEVLLPAIKDTELELPVLLAAWLSFSMSEIRGLTKSKSISGDHIRIAEVVVVVGGKDHRKEIAKNKYRNRTHRIPPYIKSLIDKVPGDRLVTLTEAQIYHRWIKFQDEHRFKHMTFHDLRHPYVKHTTKIFSLRLMDFQAQAYPDARRKTRGACQLHRGGQSRSPVRPLCNRKRFSCLPPQSKMSWILYAISMRLSGYTSTRSISSSASSVVSVSASKIALDASLRLSCRACSSCFFFACANTAA